MVHRIHDRRKVFFYHFLIFVNKNRPSVFVYFYLQVIIAEPDKSNVFLMNDSQLSMRSRNYSIFGR